MKKYFEKNKLLSIIIIVVAFLLVPLVPSPFSEGSIQERYINFLPIFVAFTVTFIVSSWVKRKPSTQWNLADKITVGIGILLFLSLLIGIIISWINSV